MRTASTPTGSTHKRRRRCAPSPRAFLPCGLLGAADRPLGTGNHVGKSAADSARFRLFRVDHAGLFIGFLHLRCLRGDEAHPLPSEDRSHAAGGQERHGEHGREQTLSKEMNAKMASQKTANLKLLQAAREAAATNEDLCREGMRYAKKRKTSDSSESLVLKRARSSHRDRRASRIARKPSEPMSSASQYVRGRNIKSRFSFESGLPSK